MQGQKINIVDGKYLLLSFATIRAIIQDSFIAAYSIEALNI